MAWDFLHIRHIEGAVTNELTLDASPVQARYFFPALLTCDKRFISVIDSSPLKSYAYRQGSRQLIPFHKTDWIGMAASTPNAEATFGSKYFSVNSVRRRNAQRNSVDTNLPKIVRDLENKFAQAAGQS